MNSTITYKCPNCDAGLIFDAEKQSFVCEFCISEFSEEELSSNYAAKKSEQCEQDDKDFGEQINEYVCSSCGAEIMADKSTIASFCYYCHNPIVVSDRVVGAHKPSKLMPFKFDKEEAKSIFLRYAKKKWFVPNDYFSAEQSDKISGIYYPFWVVDADTGANMNAKGQRVRSWRQGNYRYTETSHYAVKRAGDIHFEDISMSAISSEDKEMLEGILPYPADGHIDFSIPYLQGFVAKKRDVEREALASEVRDKMHAYAQTLLSDSVHGYAAVVGKQTSLNVKSCHWEYTLMPLWILNYHRRGRTYTYAMNGYTGKIYGKLPVSIPKLSALFGAVALVAWLIAFLIGGAI